MFKDEFTIQTYIDMQYFDTHVDEDAYDDLAIHIFELNESRRTLGLADLPDRKQLLEQYKARIEEVQSAHQNYLDRLEGIKNTVNFQIQDLVYREREIHRLAEEERQRAQEREARRQRQQQRQQRQQNARAAAHAAFLESVAAPETPPEREPTGLTLDLFTHQMRVQNEHQCEILQRIRTVGNEARDLFLSAYEPATRFDPRHAEGFFTVLGSMRNGNRDTYKVTWYKAHAEKSFWCTCPDQRFNGGRKNIYCKHISFLVCRVARILDATFFQTKRFTPQLHELFRSRLQETTVFQRQPVPTTAPYTTVVPTSSAAFRSGGKHIEPDDNCPICYDAFSETPTLNCPACKNNMHQECMEVWLERNHTCVFCRSGVWADYRH